MFSSILTFDFDLILGPFFTFWGPNGLLLGFGQGLTTVVGSTHVVEQLSFSLFLSILTFDFDSILGSFFTFWGPNGIFLGSTYLVKQLSFSLIPLILTFEFDLILFFFYFWGRGKVKKNFFMSTLVEYLLFSMLSSILTFEFDLILGFFSPFGALMVYKFARLAIKNLIDCVWVSRIPKVWKQSNLDYSSLNDVFSFGKV